MADAFLGVVGRIGEHVQLALQQFGIAADVPVAGRVQRHQPEKDQRPEYARQACRQFVRQEVAQLPTKGDRDVPGAQTKPDKRAHTGGERNPPGLVAGAAGHSGGGWGVRMLMPAGTRERCNLRDHDTVPWVLPPNQKPGYAPCDQTAFAGDALSIALASSGLADMFQWSEPCHIPRNHARPSHFRKPAHH